jgi:hypothetical protein
MPRLNFTCATLTFDQDGRVTGSASDAPSRATL